VITVKKWSKKKLKIRKRWRINTPKNYNRVSNSRKLQTAISTGFFENL